MSTYPPTQRSPLSKARKQRSGESVSFEDLVAAHKTERGPGQLPPEGVVLIGVDLELQRRMAEHIRLPGLPSEPAVSVMPASAPNNGAPKIDIAPTPGDLPDQGNSTGELIGSFAPKFDVRDLLMQRCGTKAYIIHPIFRIEDVFTAAERDLLRWLRENSRSIPVTPLIRLVIGANGEGARRLATQAGLTYNTFKNLTRALSTKFALDIVKPERNLPAIYAVYGDSSILERHKQAGFTGVVRKNGGGRELVSADAQPAPRRADLTVKDLEAILGAHQLGTPLAGFGTPHFAAGNR